MARRPRHVSTTEIETLRRRYNELIANGVDVPGKFREKYQRLEKIAGDPAFNAETTQLTIDLFAFFYAEQPRITQRRRKNGDGQVQVKLGPSTLDALDKFIADQDSVSSRPEAIQMILDQLLTGGPTSVEEHQPS